MSGIFLGVEDLILKKKRIVFFFSGVCKEEFINVWVVNKKVVEVG